MVRKLKALPVEAIVRGYIVAAVGAGLKEADKLPEPIFTPSTKAAVGHHDENISFEKAVEILGKDAAKKVKSAALAIY